MKVSDRYLILLFAIGIAVFYFTKSDLKYNFSYFKKNEKIEESNLID